LAEENQEIFLEKVKLRKFPTESENFSKTGGNLKQGECIMVSGGMNAPDKRCRLWAIYFPTISCNRYAIYQSELDIFEYRIRQQTPHLNVAPYSVARKTPANPGVSSNSVATKYGSNCIE